MKIGQLADATGTQGEAIRYYEREGLLPVAGRTESNYRVYSEAHVQRLAFIRHCRCLDMTLGRDAADCGILEGLENAAREHDHSAQMTSGRGRHLAGPHGHPSSVRK